VLVFDKFFDIEPELLLGNGSMFKNGTSISKATHSKGVYYDSSNTSRGLISEFYKILEFENEQFVIPTF